MSGILQRLAHAPDDHVWISQFPDAYLMARARFLELQDMAMYPLYGLPFAVKDNIDVASLPTTAGCPAFSYLPDETAPVVAKLLDAGAMLIGKSNMDGSVQRRNRRGGGQSGSGKSVTVYTIMGLIDAAAAITGGRIVFGGLEVTTASEAVLRTCLYKRGFYNFSTTCGANWGWPICSSHTISTWYGCCVIGSW